MRNVEFTLSMMASTKVQYPGTIPNLIFPTCSSRKVDVKRKETVAKGISLEKDILIPNIMTIVIIIIIVIIIVIIIYHNSSLESYSDRKHKARLVVFCNVCVIVFFQTAILHTWQMTQLTNTKKLSPLEMFCCTVLTSRLRLSLSDSAPCLQQSWNVHRYYRSSKFSEKTN